MSTDTKALVAALERLLARAERETCQHQETHRGGAIWTICDDCGRKWADDEGGMPKWRDPPEWIAARKALAAHSAQPVMFNGLTEAETIATASCAGLVGRAGGVRFPMHPEPHTYRWSALEMDCIRDFGAAKWAEGHREGLEDAAKVCDWWTAGSYVAQDCADSIRALKGKR